MRVMFLMMFALLLSPPSFAKSAQYPSSGELFLREQCGMSHTIEAVMRWRTLREGGGGQPPVYEIFDIDLRSNGVAAISARSKTRILRTLNEMAAKNVFVGRLQLVCRTDKAVSVTFQGIESYFGGDVREYYSVALSLPEGDILNEQYQSE